MDAHLRGNDHHRAEITVRGEIDLSNTGVLPQRLIALADPATGPITLDLSQVGFIDCAGLRMPAVLDRHIQGRGGSMRIGSPSPAVARHQSSALGIVILLGGCLIHVVGEVL